MRIRPRRKLVGQILILVTSFIFLANIYREHFPGRIQEIDVPLQENQGEDGSSLTVPQQQHVLPLQDTVLQERGKEQSQQQNKSPEHQQSQALTTEQPSTTKLPITSKFSKEAIVTVNGLLQLTNGPANNCSLLFAGDKNETEMSKQIMKRHPYKEIPFVNFLNATRRCDLYRHARKFVDYVSPDEREFPVAYSIVVHKRIEQFELLLRSIYRPSNYYCVHVDKKCSSEFKEAVKAIVDCFDNVFIASKLEVVVYAGFTRLQADINCMEELRNKYPDWKYLLNLAGSEFPLKANRELVEVLKLYNGTNIVEKNMDALNPSRWHKKYETVVNGSKGWITEVNSTNIPAPYNVNISKGSAYVALSRAAVEYVLDDPVPRAFLEWSKSTYSPDEQFWASLNDLEHNPDLKTPGGNYCSGKEYFQRAVLWYSKNCAGQNVRSVCVFGAGNLPWIKERPELIINKFDLSVDYVAYQCMTELIDQRIPITTATDAKVHLNYLRRHNSSNCLNS